MWKKTGWALTAHPVYVKIKCFLVRRESGYSPIISEVSLTCHGRKGKTGREENAHMAGCAERRGMAEIVHNDGEPPVLPDIRRGKVRTNREFRRKRVDFLAWS